MDTELNKIRLEQFQYDAIIRSFKASFLENDHLWIFGSRVDLNKRGGDIDIAIISDKINNLDKRKIRLTLYELMGEQKIDIISGKAVMSPFLKKAIKTGVLLNGRS